MLPKVRFSDLKLDSELAKVPVDYVLDQLRADDTAFNFSRNCIVDAPLDDGPLPSYLLTKMAKKSKIVPTHVRVNFKQPYLQMLMT